MPDNIFSPALQAQQLFKGYAAIVLLSVLLGIATETYALFAIPLLLCFAYVAVLDFRLVFYLLLICIPLSMEVFLPGGFATDLPGEPLILSLLFASFVE